MIMDCRGEGEQGEGCKLLYMVKIDHPRIETTKASNLRIPRARSGHLMKLAGNRTKPKEEIETMKQLDKRLRKIEGKQGVDVSHVVRWAAGQAFDDALKRSCRPRHATSRLLIHVQAVEGGHGSPVVPVPLSADEAKEHDKAKAWSRGDDWEALP